MRKRHCFHKQIRVNYQYGRITSGLYDSFSFTNSDGKCQHVETRKVPNEKKLWCLSCVCGERFRSCGKQWLSHCLDTQNIQRSLQPQIAEHSNISYQPWTHWIHSLEPSWLSRISTTANQKRDRPIHPRTLSHKIFKWFFPISPFRRLLVGCQGTIRVALIEPNSIWLRVGFVWYVNFENSNFLTFPCYYFS